jgi:hypothetical protein
VCICRTCPPWPAHSLPIEDLRLAFQSSDGCLVFLSRQHGNVRCVTCCSHRARSPNGNSKNTALLWASSVQDDLGATAIVRSILDAKAQINVRAQFFLSFVRTMLFCPSDSLPCRAQYANNFDQTALYLCAGRRTNVLTSYLIERGATVTKGSDTVRNGPSHFPMKLLTCENGAFLAQPQV